MKQKFTSDTEPTLQVAHSAFDHLLCLRGKRLRRLLRSIVAWNIFLVAMPIMFTIIIYYLLSTPSGRPDLFKAFLAIGFLAGVGAFFPLLMEVHPRTLIFSTKTFVFDFWGRSVVYDRKRVDSVTVYGLAKRRIGAVIFVSVKEGIGTVTFEATTREDASYLVQQLQMMGYNVSDRAEELTGDPPL